MITQSFIKGFKDSTFGNKEARGKRILKNDLISKINYDSSDERISIISDVISEELFNVYNCKLDIDKNSKEVMFTHCTCNDFEKKSVSKDGYACKHLNAVFYKFIQDLENDSELKNKLGIYDVKESLIKSTESSILDFLLGEDSNKDEIKIEVILNKIPWSGKISAEFKIGLSGTNSTKLYSLKDLDSFLAAYYNKIPINYGKNFTFDIRNQKFSQKDKRLIKFIELLKEIDLSTNTYRRINEKLVSGKSINIPKGMLRQFLLLVKNHRVYLGSGFYSRTLETEIIEGSIPMPLNLKEISSMIKLEAPRGVPEYFGECDDVYLYDTAIYIPPENQIEKLNRYIEAFNHGNTIFFTQNEEKRVLLELIPSIKEVTDDMGISNSLSQKIVYSKPEFKFYFDKENEIFLTFKVVYDNYEFNYFSECTDKIIFRDKAMEETVIIKLREFGFEAVNNKFVLLKDDEYIFNFFKYEINKLQELGEVFYSERFTIIKNLNPSSFKGDIKKGKFDYFDFKIKIDGISENEVYDILRAFRDNKKYYKLEKGEFLDLEDLELKKLLKLLDNLEDNGNLEDSTLSIHKSRGIYLEDYLEDEGIKYVKGRRGLKTLKNSLQKIKHKDFPLPENINAELRKYQVDGYAFFKTLDYLGFGGILGDEMGLGKTLQAITFLASNENTHSLIVAPTSLIYNWRNEFLKFAPHLKIGMVYANPTERKAIIENYKNYDVLITTYNLIQRDIDLYRDIKFDYCILDEAQNIKNPHSNNAKTVKTLNTNRRFVLTGTPLENTLMELWSIFDFIMPGYLYDEKKFNTRYNRRLEEDPVIIDEINRMIKPFILRRYKKDVIKELPDKIEKKILVPMDDEQIKVYGTYSKHVKDIIEKKVKDNEFSKSKIEILSYITKLRQICLDPSVVMDDYEGKSSKIEALVDILKSCISENHKILVFSQFTSVLKNIAKELKYEDISFYYLDGSVDSKKRLKLVEDFNNDDTSVFLISLKAGGTGLNLTSADVVIHFDPWWNPAVEDQATDRAHRIGQKKAVEVIKLISENSIEEKIINLQNQKKDLIDKVVGKNVDLKDGSNNLKDEAILSLFTN